ncbi:zinc finger BED domain-containing protein 4-like [Eucyclogobius newberryi]|uniref:zinc finger BED domain-containing protein 4-like n=1 Tax=Eucyclogobius newberryi TaxID=166745 RepID=UPI003B5C74F9
MIQHMKRKHPVYFAKDTASTPQPHMDTFLRMVPSCSTQQAAEYSDRILNILVTDMRPLSMVEGKGFKEMISKFSPQYELPSTIYFTKKMEDKYKEIKGKLIDAIKKCDSVALTTDIWTSVAVEAFMGVTCHYVGDNWEMQSFILSTLPLEDRHTAANIAEWLQDVLKTFIIPLEKVKPVVHDNGANVVKLLREKHGWASVRCSAHTLNLVVQNSLKNNPTGSKCVSGSRCLVEHFKKSELACTKLKEKQLQMGIPQHMLIQDVSTRWNCTFYMLSRLLEQRWPVTAALSDPTVTSRGKNTTWTSSLNNGI